MCTGLTHLMLNLIIVMYSSWVLALEATCGSLEGERNRSGEKEEKCSVMSGVCLVQFANHPDCGSIYTLSVTAAGVFHFW